MSAADDRPRLALSPGHGAAPERSGGSGSSGVSNVEASMRSRANTVDWAKVAPWFVREKAREEREAARKEQGA